jgi:hypothetical protein
MRDRRFIAEHRGGSLKREQHVQLMKWAIACAEKIMPLFGQVTDPRLINAMNVAEKWCNGEATVGEARKASVEAIAAARESVDPVSVAVARAVGHAVATAHMADHSLGPALYGLKAVKSAGLSVADHRLWQIKQLSEDIKELVISALITKEGHFRI